MTLTHKSKCAVRLISLCLALICSLSAAAQNRITVTEERYNDMETTYSAFPHKDRNNRDCALVVFHNIEPEGYLFDTFGSYSKAENHTISSTGEKTIFLYVAASTKKVHIRHKDSSIMPTDYNFENGALKGGQTYHVYLGEVFRGSEVGNQYLEFTINPTNAILEVEEDGANNRGVYTPWHVDTSGRASKLMRYGSYNYRVSAPEYHSTAGVVVVKNATAKHVENVALSPAFGYLTIPSSDDLQSAEIYIDGSRVATSQLSKYRLASGTHTVKITKPLFKMFERTVNITDGIETRLPVSLDANSARITLNSPDPNAKIYLREASNDRLLGTGSWSGPMEPGSYLIVCKLKGHKESVKQIDVSRNGIKEFSLPATKPMYGSINVVSSPVGATVYLDGKVVGITPLVLNNILADSHTVELEKKGYNKYSSTVSVLDGQEERIDAKLTNICTLNIVGNARRYVVSQNGKVLEPNTAGAYAVPRGSRIHIDAYGNWRQTDKSKDILVETSRNITFNLATYYLHRREFYIDLGVVSSGYTAATIALGFNINHFNFQADAEYAFSNNDFEYYESHLNWSDYGHDIMTSSYCCYAEANWIIGGRFGYTARIGTRFRLTPQVGVKGEVEGEFAALLLALRMNLQLGYRFSLYACPEYMFNIDRSDKGAPLLFGKVKNWNEGFAIRGGISFNF